MRMRMAGLLVLVCCFSGGCIIGFKYPLGPVGKAVVDPRLLGTWECRGTDEKPGRLTIMDYDGKQYLLYLATDGEEPSHMRAYSTPLKGHLFLNLQEVKPQPVEAEWLFFESTVSVNGRLSLRAVNPSPFEKVQENEKDIRRLLERNLDNPDFFASPMSCAKAELKDDGK
jgi:hypothetical protein